MRRCNKCLQRKDERDFYLRGDGKLMTACKVCHGEATSEKRKAEAWRERTCPAVGCGEAFVPMREKPWQQAARQVYCSTRCSAVGSPEAREQRSQNARTWGGFREFSDPELVVCPRCSLRGEHECFQPMSLRLGSQGWV